MEGLHAITLVFLLATMLPMSSSTRSNPNNPSSHTQATNNNTGRFGFTLPIYHRHHPKVKSFFRTLEPQWVSPIHTEREYNDLVYYADFDLGDTPTMAVLDTGSYFTWLERGPGFNPKGSRTYVPVECSTRLCNEVPDSNCTRTAGTSQCLFNLRYFDGTIMSGDVGIDYISVFQATHEGHTKKHPLRTQMVFAFQNIWVPLTDRWCLGFRRTNARRSILGIKQMQGWNFGFDYTDSNLFVSESNTCI